MRRIALTIIAGCMVLMKTSHTASFDCSHAKTTLEKTICANPKISALDAILAKNLGSAMEMLSEDGKNILREGQIRWFRYLKDVCVENGVDKNFSECIHSQYLRRVEDLHTASMVIGPYLLSRVDYFYSSKNNASNRPSDRRVSYPRIDRPLSKEVQEWNTKMAIAADAGEGSCEGNGEDVDIGFTVELTTDKTINITTHNHTYCHGTTHGYGDAVSNIFFIIPELRPLRVDDIFSSNKPWSEYLIERWFDAYKKAGRAVGMVKREDIQEVVTNLKTWSFTKDHLVIEFSGRLYAGFGSADVVVEIPWKDMQSFLVPDAPIPRKTFGERPDFR